MSRVLGLFWLLAVAFTAAGEPKILIRETGIFQLLVRPQGLVKNDSIYLLDRREGRVLVFLRISGQSGRVIR